MEAKAIRFVKIIRRKLMSDPECEDLQLEKLFLSAVEKLPDGELKNELQGNLPRYRKLVKHKKRVLQQSEQQVLNCPGENVTNTPSVARKRKTHSLEQRKPPGLIKMGKQADFSGPAKLQWLADLKWNVTLTCARTVTNKVLQTTMTLYTSKLAQHLTEDFLCGLKPDGLAILQQELKRFLHFCNHCYVASEEFKRPPTCHDLMAAMLSVYADVILLSARSKDTEDHRREAKQLVNTAMYLLRRSPGHVLDVLLQQTQATPGDSAVILPLYTKALQTVNVGRNPELYTKYMLTARQAVDLFKQESVTLLETALQVAAPAGYSEWLRDQAVNLPETEYISGVAVSRVLLEECDADTIHLLMDMLTEDMQLTDANSVVSSGSRDTTANIRDQDRPKRKTKRTSEGPLFFIDKEATSLPIELQPSDVDLAQVVEDDNSAEPENQDALEELLPAEDEEDEDVRESSGTNSHQDSNNEVERRPVVTGVEGVEDNETSSMQVELRPVVTGVEGVEDNETSSMQLQTLTVTPDRRIRSDTKRASSVRRSPKKSTGKKTRQCVLTDIAAGQFTRLQYRSKDSPKPAEIRVLHAPAPPVDSDEGQRQTMDDVTQEESDDGSVIIVSSQVACRRSCRTRRQTREVEQAYVEEAIKLREKQKPLKDDTEMTDSCDQTSSKLFDDALFYIDKKASKLTVELSSLDKKMADVATEACKVTPKNRRRSDVKRVLTARKSQQRDRSSKRTSNEASRDAEGSSFTQLRSQHSQPVSLSSPVLASGGKHARKSNGTFTQVSDDLDDSWVVIDTPDRKRGGVSKYSSALERVKDEEVLRGMGKTQTTPKTGKRELRKNTPLRTPVTVPSTPISTCKRKSLMGGETPKQDISKSGIRSPYSLRRKSILVECGTDS